MTETLMMSGTLSGRYLPARTAETVISGFVRDASPLYFDGYYQGLPCEDGDYYWLTDHHCSVWEDYTFEGDEYGARLEDQRRRRLLAPDERVLVLYAVSDTRAHLQMITVGELVDSFETNPNAYRIIATR